MNVEIRLCRKLVEIFRAALPIPTDKVSYGRRVSEVRSLLPSDAEIGATATRAMMSEIYRVGRKAGLA